MDINYIIAEEIDRFLNENIILEKKKKKKKKKKGPKNTLKKGKKLRKGLRTDFDLKKDRETNPNLTDMDAEDLNNVLDSDFINVSAVAQEVYPGHTKQGAQSQLRKKIKGLRSDSGSKYKLKKKEANKIRIALANELK